ncbi:cytochrome c maturation protein CcmE [Chloroflexota bacterium]
MPKKKRFLIGGIIIFLAIGYLGYVGFTGSTIYYYTVSEFKERESSTYGENVRITGQVVPGSLEREAQGTILRFSIIDIDGEESLSVFYQGVVPDAFKAGNEVVVEGNMNTDGTFQANTILVKCPSRYEPQE